LDTGLDGFSVYFAPYIFEDKELRDEPRSYAPGAPSDDYNYLNHIYTVNQEPTYELFETWRKYIDQYADQFNENQKVSKAILFFQIYVFVLIDLKNMLFLISLVTDDKAVYRFSTYHRIL